MSRSKLLREPVNQLRSRRGVLVVLFALLLPVLMIIMGFTIDYANMHRVRGEIRVIADLAAKTAADTLAQTSDEALARQAAKDIGLANFVAGQPLTISDNQIVFGRSIRQIDGSWSFSPGTLPYNSVQVAAARTPESPDGPVPLFFGLFYGQTEFSAEMAATGSFTDVEVCLVLDRSSSMKRDLAGTTTASEFSQRLCMVPQSDSRWVALGDAVTIFLDELRATPVNEKVAIVTFASNDVSPCGESNTTSSVDQPLTTDMDDCQNAMDFYMTAIWNGNTNIDKGLEEARLHFQSNGDPNADQIIVVLTDGKYTGAAPFNEATACANAGIQVHTITFSSSANQADMIQVAQNGGGEHYHAPDAPTLQTVFRRLAGSFTLLTD